MQTLAFADPGAQLAFNNFENLNQHNTAIETTLYYAKHLHISKGAVLSTYPLSYVMLKNKKKKTCSHIKHSWCQVCMTAPMCNTRTVWEERCRCLYDGLRPSTVVVRHFGQKYLFFPLCVLPPVGASRCLCKMGKHGLYLHSAHVVLEAGRWNSLCTLMPKPTKQEEAAGRPWAPADT